MDRVRDVAATVAMVTAMVLAEAAVQDPWLAETAAAASGQGLEEEVRPGRRCRVVRGATS